MKKLFVIIGLVVLAAGCRKTEPEPVVSVAPEFRVSGNLDGQEFDMTPGTNCLYMFTESWSNDLGVYDAMTNIAPVNGNGESLIFRLFSGGGEGTSSVEQLTNLAGEDLSLSMMENADVSLHLSYATEGEFTWIVNGNPSAGENLELELQGNEPEMVSIISDEPFCNASIELVFFPQPDCQIARRYGVTNLEVDYEEELLHFYPPTQFAGLELLWVINDEFIESFGTEIVTVPLDFMEDDINVSIVSISNGFELFPLVEQSFHLGNDDCVFPWIDLEMELEMEPYIQVDYISPEGVYFSSSLGCGGDEQPLSSFFEVLSVSDYELNEEGVPTKRIEFSTSIVLKELFEGPSGEELILELENASIAFAY